MHKFAGALFIIIIIITLCSLPLACGGVALNSFDELSVNNLGRAGLVYEFVLVRVLFTFCCIFQGNGLKKNLALPLMMYKPDSPTLNIKLFGESGTKLAVSST